MVIDLFTISSNTYTIIQIFLEISSVIYVDFITASFAPWFRWLLCVGMPFWKKIHVILEFHHSIILTLYVME